MIKVIELLGIPGCGKSTLIKICAPNPEFVVQTKDLEASMKRNRGCTAQPEVPMPSTIRRFVEDYPNANALFVRKLAEAYNGLNELEDGIALLDEGLFNRITGIPYDREFMVDEAFHEMMKLVSEMEILVFDCRCPFDTALERLRSRPRVGYNNSGRYYDENDEVVKAKLRVKRQNIDTVLSAFTGRKIPLDMLQPLGLNVLIIKSIVDEMFPDIKDRLWL